MTFSNDCSGLETCGCGGEETCCWARAIAIQKFKKRVLIKYIFEVIFDVVVSVLSVVTDIVSIGLSVQKGRWGIAIVTAIPVLLPTIVFTNVYLQDETQGYCKLPKNRRRVAGSRTVSESDDKESSATSTTAKASSTETKMEQLNSKLDFHCGTCHMLCVSCTGCWGGMLRSICYKDAESRDDSAQTVKRSIKRLLKYVFGTFVLRYISLAWYAKAFIFGVRAYKEPKKYMKMALPNTHWGYDLLVKLDFLQAALENAPQCIVQLYVLLIYSDENQMLGILTLVFSFVDFVRVSVSVQWDIRKGPVIAPTGCYGTLWWKLMNMSSWIFLYIGRSAALALVIATAKGWTIAIPSVILIFHTALFTKLFSKERYGVAAQKVFVSVFISIFFLPEFDSLELPILTQFYYAVIHIENLFFIVPWNGMNYEYCLGNFNLGGFRPQPGPRNGGSFSSDSDMLQDSIALALPADPEHCLIDPTVIVIAVPVLTMIGIVMRLAASKRMSDFKKTIPPRDDTMQMEERIADIYSKKWTTITFNKLLQSFLKMLKSEVIPVEKDIEKKDDSTTEKPVFIISPSFNREFAASHSFIQAISCFSVPKKGDFLPPEGNSIKTKRSMSVDACGPSSTSRPNFYMESWLDKSTTTADPDEQHHQYFLGVNDNADIRKRSKSQDDINFERGWRNADNVRGVGSLNYENNGGGGNQHPADTTWM